MAYIVAPKFNNYLLTSQNSSVGGSPEQGDWLLVSERLSQSKLTYQQWVITPVAGLEGVSTISTKSSDGAMLYITAPKDPKNHDRIYLSSEILDSSSKLVSSQQQWRISPMGNRLSSYIQNYAEPGLVFDVPGGNTKDPLQLYSAKDNDNQKYIPQLTLP